MNRALAPTAPTGALPGPDGARFRVIHVWAVVDGVLADA